MHLLAPLAVILILAGFIALKFFQRKKKYERSRSEVADLLNAFLMGDSRAWDTFISFPLKDEELEAIRLRCAGLDTEFPPDKNGHFCDDKGIEAIRVYVGELRSVANSRRK